VFSAPVPSGGVQDGDRSDEVYFEVRAGPGGAGSGGVAAPGGPTPAVGAESGRAGSRRWRVTWSGELQGPRRIRRHGHRRQRRAWRSQLRRLRLLAPHQPMAPLVPASTAAMSAQSPLHWLQGPIASRSTEMPPSSTRPQRSGSEGCTISHAMTRCHPGYPTG